MGKWLFCILMLLVSSYAFSESQHIYEFKALSASVYLEDNETIDQAVNRAKSMLQINAVSMTPKFVSLDTHYDSKTDEIIEKGLIAQGANVRVFNTQYERGLEDGRIVLHVTADVSVDISAMQAKLGSEKRERLLESTIDDLSNEYQKLSAVIEKMKRNITLSNLDALVVTGYYAALNSSLTVIDGDAIKNQLLAHKQGTTSKGKLKAELLAAYEMFVLPFMANPMVDYQVLNIIPHEYAVAEVKIRVTINRKGDYNAPWYPSLQNGADVELCNKFFYGCDALVYTKLKEVEVKEVLRPKYCGDSLFEFLPYYAPGAKSFSDDNNQIRCGSSKKYAYKNMNFYQTGYTNMRPMAQMPSDPIVFTDAFKELSNTSFWLHINIGDEKFKVNISNLLIEDVTMSAFMPEAKAINGLKVGFKVEGETYDITSHKWKDVSGKLLRFQSRQIAFY